MSHLLSSVSTLPLIFGGAAISGEGGGYGFGEISETQAIDLLLYSYERGLRIFDTAPIYGFGESEKRMGKAFKDIREKVFLVSKSGVTWNDQKRVDMNNDPKIAQKMLEQSLRDLDSDYIDLYMIHWPDSNVDIRKPVEVLAKAQLEGKIKHLGLCNTYPEDYLKAKEVGNIEVIQNQLNFFERESFKCMQELILEQGLSFMSWGTLDKGILSGRVQENRRYDKSDARSWAPWWKNSNYRQKVQVMKELLPMLEKEEATGLQLALSFNLSQKGASHLICGARSTEQLEGVLNALSKPLSESLLRRIEEKFETLSWLLN